MKQIINRRKYDTETAKKLGECCNGYSPRDFQYTDECLYQKKTGEFFLYGESGPMGKYAVSAGLNTWSGGEKITPLTVEDAREWTEKHLTCDEYEAIFGEVEE